MQDDTLTIGCVKELAKKFVAERDWQLFHTPKNLSMSIAAEASELMELFLWVESAKSLDRVAQKRSAVEDEVADIFLGLLSFCNACDIDLATVFLSKLEKTKKKYPIDLVKGKDVKYTDIE